MNLFSVAVAQGIAQVTPAERFALRLVMWVVFTAYGIAFTLRYGHANPAARTCPAKRRSL